MPKSRQPGSSITYSCDICDFKVTNSYIFKRHLHRCYTLHGVASKRSSHRQPMRVKGSEGVRSTPGDGPVLGRKGEWQTDGGKMVEGENGCYSDSEDVVIEGVSPGETQDLVGRSPMSSQWSVKDSPRVLAGREDDCSDEDEDGDDDDDDEMIVGDDEGRRIVSLNGDHENTLDCETAGVGEYVKDDMSSTDPPSTVMRARFERNYQCEYCPFKTLKSKDYLYHLRDVHRERLNVFECPTCDYASRYNNKLMRHMAIHWRSDPSGSGDDQGVDFGDDGDDNEDNGLDLSVDTSQELKVKPLKLKRLHVKTPSLFQVSHNECQTKREKDLPESSPSGKNVFKMVLSADGSHDYQCRDCLFYANTAVAIKKHYSLCHSKLLLCPHCDFTTTSQAEHYEHIVTHNGKITYHKCPECSYVTHAKPTFENHRLHHGSNAPFKCRVCNFAADSESKVKRHMATQHTNRHNDQTEEVEMADGRSGDGGIVEDAQQVPGSSRKVGDTQAPRRQIDLGVGKAKRLLKFKCPHCLVVCLRRANLTRHLVCKHDYSQKKASVSSKSMEKLMMRKKLAPLSSQASPGAVFPGTAATPLAQQDDLQCSECPYLAKWPSDLRRHQQVHTVVKRFKCPICTNKYKYLGDLNVHMRRDHLMEPQHHTMAEDVVVSEVIKKSSPAVFRCPICAFATGSKADLEQHTRQHGDIQKTFQCRLCDYQTYWRGDVGRHLFRHHNIHLSKDGHELETHFIFRSDIRPLTKMPMSLKTEHAVEGSNPSPSPMGANSGRGDLSSPGRFSFKTALTTPTPPGGKESALVCRFQACEYRTTTAAKMEVHAAIHENIKIFVCPTCGKRANYKWDIVKHMLKVHKNPSACTNDVLMLPVAEARDTIREYLARFERKVMDTPTYGCSVCDFKSGEKSLVTKHVDDIHPGSGGHVLSFSVPLLGAVVKQEVVDQVGEAEGKVLTFVEPPPEELSRHSKPYACGNCKKAESSLSDIQRHYNYAHPYKEVRVIYTPDGTEFDCNTFEIYPSVKKSTAAVSTSDNFLGVDESSKPLIWHNMSPNSSVKTVRPDSKYSNPKMHGYVKPFKCSVCGLRSNWKWDLKKHLRSKHPNDGGFVIMLSIEEAQMTYGKECSRSHPKCESQGSTDVAESQDFNESISPSRSSPMTTTTTTGRSKSGQPPCVGTNFDPGRRQWKCSGCDYITNWRRNMARHMTRRHSRERNSVHVISLHMLSREQQEALMEERNANLEMMAKGTSDLDEDFEATEQDQSVSNNQSGTGSEGRMWKCPKCSYHSTLRTHIIIHMQKHELRPFLCGVCNAPFMNRSPLHSHIQKLHRRGDYIKLVRVNIRYDGVIDQSHLGIVGHQQVFYCTLCQLKFSDQSQAVDHLKSTHGVQERADDYIGMANVKPPTTLTSNHPYSAISNSKLFAVNGDANHSYNGAVVDGNVIRRKLHHCKLCPYTTQKKSMLSFHMTYHIPTPANRIKCKYCPYYVSTTRLLHQHQRKWHLENKKGDGATHNAPPPLSMMWEYPQATPPSSPYKTGGEAGTPRRHACQKCPYTTNCRNDFYYHKQFHRPKRTAEYKCEFCDYWVVHKRLLKQHMRLHEEDASLQELSPAKSVYSDPGLVYDPIEMTELAALKQNMISAKILPSLSRSPKISPMKIASRCSVDDKPGYVLKNGLYRKLHKCPKCPYTNTRARNMNLHVMMHGPRESSYPLMRCPYCDYYVGSKGLLSHHMKVHQKQYGDTPENDARRAALGLDDDEGDDSDDMVDIQAQQKVDTLLQISRMKRFGCEKCPYASAKRQHFERHLELHGSRQRYTCQYCDYSVPSSYLLTQHSRLHLMPNQNLLSCQSVTNLHRVGEVPADVALASALPPSDSDMAVTISVIHDHLGLYENSIYDPEHKKLYRCDRCPYANVRRDYLLSHLKFHMVSSSLVCPYCDYSAPKQALLSQHIRVHFCPLPELSDWLLENGQTERETSHRNINMTEALKVAQEYQSQSKKKSKVTDGEKKDEKKDAGLQDGGKAEEKENLEDQPPTTATNGPDPYVCQYCDREFMTSDKCVKHELQHLIGNQFEMALKVLTTDKHVEKGTKPETPKRKAGSDPRRGEDRGSDVRIRQCQGGVVDDGTDKGVESIVDKGGEVVTQRDEEKMEVGEEEKGSKGIGGKIDLDKEGGGGSDTCGGVGSGSGNANICNGGDGVDGSGRNAGEDIGKVGDVSENSKVDGSEAKGDEEGVSSGTWVCDGSESKGDGEGVNSGTGVCDGSEAKGDGKGVNSGTGVCDGSEAKCDGEGVNSGTGVCDGSEGEPMEEGGGLGDELVDRIVKEEKEGEGSDTDGAVKDGEGGEGSGGAIKDGEMSGSGGEGEGGESGGTVKDEEGNGSGGEGDGDEDSDGAVKDGGGSGGEGSDRGGAVTDGSGGKDGSGCVREGEKVEGEEREERIHTKTLEDERMDVSEGGGSGKCGTDDGCGDRDKGMSDNGSTGDGKDVEVLDGGGDDGLAKVGNDGSSGSHQDKMDV